MDWKITQQAQTEHLGDYCDLSHAIDVPGGQIRLVQRIEDTAKGYALGQSRAYGIVRAVNNHARLVAALENMLALYLAGAGDPQSKPGEYAEQARAALDGARV